MYALSALRHHALAERVNRASSVRICITAECDRLPMPPLREMRDDIAEVGQPVLVRLRYDEKVDFHRRPCRRWPL